MRKRVSQKSCILARDSILLSFSRVLLARNRWSITTKHTEKNPVGYFQLNANLVIIIVEVLPDNGGNCPLQLTYAQFDTLLAHQQCKYPDSVLFIGSK